MQRTSPPGNSTDSVSGTARRRKGRLHDHGGCRDLGGLGGLRPAHTDAGAGIRDPGARQVTFETSGTMRLRMSHDPPGFGRLLVPHLSPVARRANLTSPSSSLHSHRSPEEVVCCCEAFLCWHPVKEGGPSRNRRSLSPKGGDHERGRSDQDVTILPAACIATMTAPA
jgi:hypothetical protein